MVAKQEHVDLSDLMGNVPQEITNVIGWNHVKKRNLAQPQLADKPFINDAGIGTRVNESGEGIRAIREEQLGMEQGFLVEEWLHGGITHQNLPFHL